MCVHGIGNNLKTSRGCEYYTCIKKVKTNLYEVRKKKKQSKLVLVIEHREEQLTGKGTLWGKGNVLSLSQVLVTWVYIFFKTH